MATLGGLRGPGKGPGAVERGRRGGRSAAALPPPPRRARAGTGVAGPRWVIGREVTRAINTATADPRGGEGHGLGRP